MLIKWCHCPVINWCATEANSCITSSLPALLFAPSSMRPSQHANNPVVLSFLKIWKHFRNHYGLKSSSVLTPIYNNHCFLPSTIDETFKLWKKFSLVSFSDLYLHKTFGSFADLVTKSAVSKQDVFRYFHLRNFAKTLHFPYCQ